MQLSHLLVPALLATSTAAKAWQSMESVTDMVERNSGGSNKDHFVGGPTAIARAMAAARYLATVENRNAQPVHADAGASAGDYAATAKRAEKAVRVEEDSLR